MNRENMDETQIITSIITGVFGLLTVILAAYLKAFIEKTKIREKSKMKLSDPEKSKMKKRERLLRRALFVSFVIVCILIGLLVWVTFYRPLPPSTPFVKITYPLDNAYVNLNETIQGVSHNVPERQVIWVVVYLDGYRYYPAETSAVVRADGDWSSFVWIGEQKDVGRSFDIIAVLADKNIQDKFNAYVAESRSTGVWAGLESLPEGATNPDTSIVPAIRK